MAQIDINTSPKCKFNFYNRQYWRKILTFLVDNIIKIAFIYFPNLFSKYFKFRRLNVKLGYFFFERFRGNFMLPIYFTPCLQLNEGQTLVKSHSK